MRRREFIAGLGGVAALPVAPRAQQYDRVRRIGMLWPYAEGDPEANAWLATFREELEKLGWVEGRNVRFDHRWAALDEESVRRFAGELVALQPDVILTQSTPNTAVMQQQTSTIPILLTQGTDPVGAGFVASLSRPGGNVTGFINLEASPGSKWLELLTQIAPRVKRVAFLFNPATAPYFEYYLSPFKAAAASFGVEPIAAPFHNALELESVVAAQAPDTPW